jgi:hypothetical protein
MAPLGFATVLRHDYSEKWNWVQAHQWQIGKHNYREAAERLEAMLTASNKQHQEGI